MNISFSGTPTNPRVTYEICRDALNFYAGLLMSTRLVNSLDIQVKFLNLRRRKNDDGSYALCWTEEVCDRPKSFTIEIQKTMGLESTLKSLAHEMVHVKQDSTGQCYQYMSNDKVRYNKDVYNSKDIEYWDWPWEIEAHGRERGLYIRFMEYRKKRK